MTTTRCTCGHDMRSGIVDGHTEVLWCPACDRITERDPKPAALKLPGLDRGKQSRRTRELESELVRRIRVTLQGAGYIIHRIGQFRADQSGQDRGTPDMIVTRTEWVEGAHLAFEVKTHDGILSEEQKRLVEQRRIVIVRSVQDALEAAERLGNELVLRESYVDVP